MSIEWDDYDSSQDGVAGFSLSVIILNGIASTVAMAYFLKKFCDYTKGTRMNTSMKVVYLVTVIGFYCHIVLCLIAFILYIAGANDWVSQFLLYYTTGDSWVYYGSKYMQYLLFLTRIYLSFKGSAYALQVCGKEAWIAYVLFIFQQILMFAWSMAYASSEKSWVLFVLCFPVALADMAIPGYMLYIFVKRLSEIIRSIDDGPSSVLIETVVKVIILTTVASIATHLGYPLAYLRWWYHRDITYLWLYSAYLSGDCLVTIVCGSLVMKSAEGDYKWLFGNLHKKAAAWARQHFGGGKGKHPNKSIAMASGHQVPAQSPEPSAPTQSAPTLQVGVGSVASATADDNP